MGDKMGLNDSGNLRAAIQELKESTASSSSSTTPTSTPDTPSGSSTSSPSRMRSSTHGGSSLSGRKSSSSKLGRSGSNSPAGSLITSSLTSDKKKLKKMKKKVTEKDTMISDLQHKLKELENEKDALQRELQSQGKFVPSSTAITEIRKSGSEESPSKIVSSSSRTYCFDTPNLPTNIRFSEEGAEKVLEAASLEKLLEKLTFEVVPFKPPPLQKAMSLKKNRIADKGSMTSLASMPINHLIVKGETCNLSDELVDEFFHCYTEFTNPNNLVDLLLLRYRGPDFENCGEDTLRFFSDHKQAIRRKVVFMFKRWSEVRPYDFQNTDLTERVITYFTSVLDKKKNPSEVPAEDDIPDSQLAADIQEMITTIKEALGEGEAAGSSIALTQIVPEDFAAQLTLMEYNMMKGIRSREFLKQRWNKDHKETEAPNLLRAIEWFNKMSSWFSTEIVKQETAEGRKTVIVNLIRVAMKCNTLRNYKAIMEVLASLHSHAISCLKHTWELVPSKMIEELDNLGKMLSPKANYKNYRALLQTEPAPFVPFLGVFLTDLTFLDDCKPDNIEGLVNVDKVRTMGRKIKEFHRFHTQSYDIQPNSTLQAQITKSFSGKLFDANDIYRICKLREEMTELEPSTGSGLSRKRAKKGGSKYSNYFGNGIELTGQEQVNVNHTELTERDWLLLLSGANTLIKKKDDPIVKEGEQNQSLYIIKMGRVRVEVFGEDGAARVVAFMEEDAIFGEMSLFNKSNKATARVVADDPNVELLQIPVPFIYQLFESEPDLAKRFYGALAMIFAKRLRDRSAAPSQPRIEKSGSTIGNSIRTVTSKGMDSSRSKEIDPPPGVSRPRSGTLKKGTPVGEVVIKDYPCVLKQKLNHNGKLSVLQSCMAFSSKAFTFETKYSFPFDKISAIAKKGSTNLLVVHESKQYLFDLKAERDQAFEMIQSFWKQASLQEGVDKPTASENEEKKFGGPVDFQFEDPLTKDDWNLMLKGAKTTMYQPGASVIKQGESFQRLYHVASGCCVVDKNGTAVGRIRAGEIFGEISFLDSHGATVSVLASEEGAELYIIEGYFIRILFNIRPGFAGRFFHYICCLLASRLSR